MAGTRSTPKTCRSCSNAYAGSTAIRGPVPAGTNPVTRLETIAMPPELGHETHGVSECEPWDRVVAHAAPCDHIVKLYQDEDFLNRAVCRFAGAAIANGEGIILVPTLTHWNA